MFLTDTPHSSPLALEPMGQYGKGAYRSDLYMWKWNLNMLSGVYTVHDKGNLYMA